MAIYDVAGRTVTLKIVYYGCALGGKTTNLVTLHRLTDPESRQNLVSVATDDDRTLFFDLLPLDLGHIGAMSVKVKVYTVPGQVHYELTRRKVLGGADGIVLVVDSSPEARDANTWAAENLRFNLRKNGLDAEKTPIVIQWNKRDVPRARPIAELRDELNSRNLPSFEAVATNGAGVVETFAEILRRTIAEANLKSGRAPVPDEQLAKMVHGALELAISRAPKPGERSTRVTSAQPHANARAMAQDSLLSESVSASYELAEQLGAQGDAQDPGGRRALMMDALARLTPLLADPKVEALPGGVMSSLLQGCGRRQGSLLVFNSPEKTMIEHEVVPAGEPLNGIIVESLGSVAYRLSQTDKLRVIEDVAGEVFFGTTPEGLGGMGSLLIAPLACDGNRFGALFAYGRFDEPAFDASENEYWTTAATLVGLSLHWRALRQYQSGLLAPGADRIQGGVPHPQE